MSQLSEQEIALINQEIKKNINKFRSCRTIFHAAALVAVLLIALNAFFFSVAVSEGAYKVAVVNFLACVAFMLLIYIFTRENKILRHLIFEVSARGSTIFVTTIFSSQISLEQVTLRDLSPEWIRKRRIWPIYLLRGTDAIQYARQASKIVKCVEIQSNVSKFYWACTDITSIMKLIPVAPEHADD